jgi:transposase
MPQGREKTMIEKREILLALRRQDSIRKIHRNLHVHRRIIRVIHDAAAKKGWLNPLSEMPGDYEIAQLGTGASSSKPAHQLDPYVEKIKEWHAEGTNAVVIHRFLKAQYQSGCKIGALRRYIRKVCPDLPDPVMVRNTTPGEVMDVDFGFLGRLWDPLEQKFKKVWVFSGRLRHSRKAYRRLVWEQDVVTFLFCHVLAFECFGGVPLIVCLDNLKAGVIKSCIDNNMLNRSYKELAEYYGFMISPCLPRTPEHKGGVENDIKYIKGNFWPEIRELLKSCPHTTLHQAQEKLDAWDLNVACQRKINGLGRSPNDIFISEEKGALKELPFFRFEPTEWLECIVRREWWIVFEGSRYSVPYRLIGKTVQVRVTSQFVKVFFEHQEVAYHPLASVKGSYLRNPNHAPPFKEEVLMCNRQGLLMMAMDIGKQTHAFCGKMFSDKCVDKLKPVRCLLKLADEYGKNRLEKACERAIIFDIIQYSSVKNILEKELDKEPIHLQTTPPPPKGFKYARNLSDYQRDVSSDERDDLEVCYG